MIDLFSLYDEEQTATHFYEHCEPAQATLQDVYTGAYYREVILDPVNLNEFGLELEGVL